MSFEVDWSTPSTTALNVFGGQVGSLTWNAPIVQIYKDSVLVPAGISGLPSGFHVNGNTNNIQIFLAGSLQNGSLAPVFTFSSIVSHIRNYSVTAFNATTILGGMPSTFWADGTSIFDIATDLFAITITCNDTNNGALTFINFHSIVPPILVNVIGNYNIIGTGWRITNLTHPGFPAGTFLAGDIAQITTDPPTDLTQVTKITINGGDIPPPYILQAPQVLQFLIPCPDGSIPTPCPNQPSFNCCPNPNFPPLTNAPVTINGTQFTGSVLLGTISIYVANFQGIYSLKPGQTHDTVYTNVQSGNGTINLPIPNPFFKTGFIGG